MGQTDKVGNLRILMLEDNPADAELNERVLRKAGMEFVAMRVDSESAFKQALTEFKPDIVLADYNLPSFNGSIALEYLQRVHPDLPVIMVTGAIGEEKAAELLRAGARDYILKDRLARLPAAIRQAIDVQNEIQARRESEQRLREAENKFRMLFETANDGIFLLDESGFVDCNQKAACMYGLAKEDMFGHMPDEFSPQRQPDGRLSAEVAAEKNQAALRGESQYFEWCALRADNTIFDVDISLNRIEFGGAVYLQGIMRDITERKKAEDLIRNLAFFDALTQLPNRRLLHDRLLQAMLASKRSNHFGALMFLDLDNFKPLNDEYGHLAGDLLLVEVARRISLCVREVDTVARYGGDEFVIMLSDLDTSITVSIAQATIIAEKIRLSLCETYVLRLRQGSAVNTIVHRCTSSIGVVLFINNEANTEDLIKWADSAMYSAKKAGRNAINFFDPPTGLPQPARKSNV